MDEHNILIALAGIISALGLKEVWSIIKQKIDIGAKKEEREESVYAQQIEVLTNKIQQLETKIEGLEKMMGTLFLLRSPLGKGLEKK